MAKSPEHAAALAPAVAAPSGLSQAFGKIASARRSVYSYVREPVPRHLVELAVREALQAPNHHRTRPLRLFAFLDEGLTALANAYEGAANRLGRDGRQARARATEAPIMMVAACLAQTSNPRVRQVEEEFACAAALENLPLSLASNGVSSLITTGDLPESPEVHQLVNIRPGEGRVVAVIDIGYANTARRLPDRVVPEPDFCIQWRDER